MEERQAFAPKTVAWLIAVGLTAFGGAAYFAITGDDPGASKTSGANAFSYSAIGHKGLVETLRRLNVPVLVNRGIERVAGPTSLLVVAEPPAAAVRDGRVPGLGAAGAVLWVLPKRRGPPAAAHPGWVEFVRPLARLEVERVLRHIVRDGTVVRTSGPLFPKGGSFRLVPTLDAPQLMRSSRLDPIVATEDGMLVGEFRRGGRPIWILSDPDVLSNHGLGRGDNAVFVLKLIERLRPEGGTVIIDETAHGFAQRRSLWRSALRFPFVIATIQALAAVLVLTWAASARFGAPIPLAPALEPGKSGLIDNTAGLLQSGGHGPEILKRYLRATLRDVARRLHLPRNLDEAALVGLVDRIGRARGVSADYRRLRREAEATAEGGGLHGLRLVQSARNLHRWKQEMIHGP